MTDVCICSSTEAWTESEVQLTVQMASSSIQDHRTASAICKLRPKSPKTTQNAKLKPRSFKAPIQLVYRINWFKEEGQWAKWFFITWNTPKDSTSVLNFPFKETFLFLWLLKSGALLAHLRVGDSSHLPCVPLEHLPRCCRSACQGAACQDARTWGGPNGKSVAEMHLRGWVSLESGQSTEIWVKSMESEVNQSTSGE